MVPVCRGITVWGARSAVRCGGVESSSLGTMNLGIPMMIQELPLAGFAEQLARWIIKEQTCE